MTDIETAKRNAANRAVKDHFDPQARFIGIGSGSTIVYVVEAIKALGVDTSNITFVPTGYQSRQVIVNAGLTPIAFDSLPGDVLLDLAFDGADEVDEDLNCIKGGGACLYQEKLVAMQARKFICVADHRKLRPRLLSTWPSIPIEVEPLATPRVLRTLRTLGSPSPTVRTNLVAKSGPIKTDQDNFIVDAPFPTLLTPTDVMQGKGEGKGEGGRWEVEALAREIKLIQGVLEVGLFVGRNGEEVRRDGEAGGGQKPVAAYFGMGDGGVEVRRAKERG
ncbi:MAG: ribose-5-phosphate isomerase rki1 [Pleopsidium flavum]|nr:MAG: ribose-5-phosphate isomerase rki1 [Pleopsidium flavum]KAI9874906.1 MAG: ribose-5-phosphate isomerase rki1 [Pleopsidium flavum]